MGIFSIFSNTLRKIKLRTTVMIIEKESIRLNELVLELKDSFLYSRIDDVLTSEKFGSRVSITIHHAITLVQFINKIQPDLRDELGLDKIVYITQINIEKLNKLSMDNYGDIFCEELNRMFNVELSKFKRSHPEYDT